MTLSETTTMASDTSSTGNHTHQVFEERSDDLIEQQHEKQEHSDGPVQQDKLRERTLALIKPDAVQAHHQQAIIDRIISAGFAIIQQKQVQFTLAQACLFYREHENKPFYDQLTEWMSSAPIYAMILEKENAIQDWRTLMGPTNAIKAREIDPTSIRALFGKDGSHNATHGSDCLTSAEREIDIVFGATEEPSDAITDDTVVQSDQTTTNTATIPSNAHDDSRVEDNTSNKDQSLAKEIDSSPDDDLDTKATTGTDDTESFVPPPAATPTDTSNDVEHPVITSDSLSHPASADHDDAKHNIDAPTCPKSDFVELLSGDSPSATVTTTNPSQQDGESACTKVDVKEAHTDNNATAQVNSNIDETLEKEHGSQNGAECNLDASLLDQHHQQEPSNPVTENVVAKAEPVLDKADDIHNQQQQECGGDNDQTASLDSAGPDIACVAVKVDEQEKDNKDTAIVSSITDESATKAYETPINSTADDNITQSTDHVVDSTVDNNTTNDNSTTNEPIIEQKLQQQPNQGLKVEEEGDNPTITSEQEAESLSIQEASTAVPTSIIDKKDIKDENDQPADATLTTVSATKDIETTDIAPAESTIDDSDKIMDVEIKPTDIAPAESTIGDSDKIMDVETKPTDIAPVESTIDDADNTKDVEIKPTDVAPVESTIDDTDSTKDVETKPTDTVPVETTNQESDKAADVEKQELTTPQDTKGTTDERHDAGIIDTTEGNFDAVPLVTDDEESKGTVDATPSAEEKTATSVVNESSPEAMVLESTTSMAAVTEKHDVDSVVVDQEHESSNVAAEPESNPESAVAGKSESIHESAVAGESESIPQEPAPGIAVVDEREATKDLPSIDEPAAIKEAPVEESNEHAEDLQSQSTVDTEKAIETNDEPTGTDDNNQEETVSATTAIESEPKTVSNDDQSVMPSEMEQVKEAETTTVEQGDASHDENSAVDSTKATKSDDEPAMEKNVASTSPPASTARSALRKSPTGIAKAPAKSTSPPTATKKSPTAATGTTKPAAASRLRRPGTTLATGTGATATTAAGTGVKKTTPKTSTSPGRTPLPRVATLAKKPVTKTDETKATAESKPTTTGTKKRSSVISRLTAPTAASANKRTSEPASSTPASTGKAASGNGTATTRTRVTSTTGHQASGASTATTRRPVSKAAASTDKPATGRRTSPSSTADKTTTATARRTSPPSSTKTARSTTAAPASSSRLSSTTTKPSSGDASVAKRSPTRRVSPPTSTHLAATTKPTTKVSKPTTTEKKSDMIRKKTKPSGTATATTKTGKDVNTKSEHKEKKDDDVHVENIHNDDDAAEHSESTNKSADEDTSPPAIEEEKETDHQTTPLEQPSVVEETIQQEETGETDAEVAATATQDNGETTGATLNPTTTDSNSRRPRTPEMAQLRNKFENLQAPTTVTPTRSSNKQPSSAPHNIKDLISRFN